MKILVADPIAEEGVNLLRGAAEVDVRIGLKPEELIAVIGDYQALAVRSETKVTAAVIEAGKQLQVIGRAGVGVDNIDVEAATRRGIVVVNAPSGNIIAAAEHTVALMLALARHIPQAHTSLKGGQWQRSRFMGIDVSKKILGIVGLGRVGSEVARRAQGLEMKVIAYDPFVSAEHAQAQGVELTSLEDLLKRSDFISVHTPLTEATKGMIGAKELALVKPTGRIINCARGGVVDEQALYEAVESGRLAGAAVDVFSQEPATDNILLKSDRIVVTPHLGASTAEAQVNVAIDVAEEIMAVLRGASTRYAVNLPLIAPEALTMLTPHMRLATFLGSLATQLAEGQLSAITVEYSGEIAQYDTRPLTAAIIKGLLEPISDQPINLVNASFIARSRGLRITEQKGMESENYSNLITLRVYTSAGTTTAAGTTMRSEPHIVLVNGYWVDVPISEGHWLFSDHLDRPGLIGAVGTLLGKADINISCMYVGRLKPRGKALMILGLDEPIPEEQRQQILAIPDIYTARAVKL